MQNKTIKNNASQLKESAPLVIKFRILAKNCPSTQNLVQNGRDYARFVTFFRFLRRVIYARNIALGHGCGGGSPRNTPYTGKGPVAKEY